MPSFPRWRELLYIADRMVERRGRDLMKCYRHRLIDIKEAHQILAQTYISLESENPAAAEIISRAMCHLQGLFVRTANQPSSVREGE